MEKSLLIFGSDFLPIPQESELNFWRDIVFQISEEFSSIIVVSFNHRRKLKEKLNSNTYLFNISPLYFGAKKYIKKQEETGPLFNKLPLGILFKTVNFVFCQKLLNQLIEEFHITNFHFMRIFGLSNQPIINRHPEISFSMTIPTHVDRGFPFHYIYHLIKNNSFKQMDKLIATTKATKKRLLELGLAEEKIEVIPWTISSSSNIEVPSDEIEKIKQKYQICKGSTIVLWSGPIQDTGKKEFYQSIEIAKLVLKTNPSYTFIFTFKPGSLKSSYLWAIHGLQNIYIFETNKSEFDSIKNIADIFLSPIMNKNRTIAPPLTWIEMLQSGIPIITFELDGVEEIIEHGKNGFIAHSSTDASRLILDIKSYDKEFIREACFSSVKKKHDIKMISDSYISLWRGIKFKK
jgi:glycosyltransferase involved in cell wall biosynthesis